MKLHYCFAASFCLLALSGCQSGSLQASAAPAVQSTAAAETPAAQQTDTAVQSEHESASQTSIDLKGLTDLVGKSDSDVYKRQLCLFPFFRFPADAPCAESCYFSPGT